MYKIRMLCEDMKSEIKMAKHYYESALYTKDINPDQFRKFAEIARQELNHAIILHDMALYEVNKAKDAGKTPTDEMMTTWEKIHVEYVDEVKTLEYKLSKF